MLAMIALGFAVFFILQCQKLKLCGAKGFASGTRPLIINFKGSRASLMGSVPIVVPGWRMEVVQGLRFRVWGCRACNIEAEAITNTFP